MMIFEELGLGLKFRSRIRLKLWGAPSADFLGINF